jgi:glycosidase
MAKPKKNTVAPEHSSSGETPWRPHPHLYQIHTWAWLDALSARAGRDLRLKDVPDAEWDRLQELGFDVVYLLGIWDRSPAGRRVFRTDASSYVHFDHALPDWTMRNVIGSPFSIRDYAPDPRIGTWADLDEVRRKLHDRGMRLILDFIPNHTGPDHHWITSHPEYFLLGTDEDFRRDPSAFMLVEPDDGDPYFVARGRDPYFAPWADTVQFDYYRPEARAAFVETLRQIAEHCDGLRCDMAMLVLNDIFARTWGHLLRDRPAPPREFWEEAIPALPADFLWMAEVYWDMEPRLVELGFSYTYDKRLYDRLLGSSPQDVRWHLVADVNYQSRMARFIENHDEARCTAAFGRERVPGLATLIATLPGLRFIHQGQFEGKTIHLPMPLNKTTEEAPDPELVAVHEKILQVADDDAFHQGEWQLLDVAPQDDASHENLLAYRWRTANSYKLVVVNLVGGHSQGRLHVASELGPAPRYEFADELADEIYVRDRAEIESDGLYVRLDPHGAHVFSVTSVA